MIAVVLIVLVALLGLAATIGLLAWAYLRGDDDNGQAAPASVQVPVPDTPEPMAPGPGLTVRDLPADHAEAPGRLYPDTSDDEPGPDDGDAYAAELRAIGEAAAADVLELHPVWDPAVICPVVAAAGMSLEDWDRCYKTANRRYWADRRRAWKKETLDWWADYRDWRAQMGLAA